MFLCLEFIANIYAAMPPKVLNQAALPSFGAIISKCTYTACNCNYSIKDYFDCTRIEDVDMWLDDYKKKGINAVCPSSCALREAYNVPDILTPKKPEEKTESQHDYRITFAVLSFIVAAEELRFYYLRKNNYFHNANKIS